MRFLLIALLLAVNSYTVMAQNTHKVVGTVTDTASNAKLYYATISILNAKDSTLYKFTRANEDGKFTLDQLKSGKFILLLTYPDYADFVSPFTLDSAHTLMDFKQIDLKSKARVLNEVIIKGQAAAIKIKGDTTEFNASSYSIQPNDKVEDLLKKLPGIQIDKDGKITAQGKSIPKVLVDGEEFFGDDPTLVTKNLRADMVDKVQLYEKSSDQAAFTGVDDGQKTPTINIKLKEDMKKGYFGKIDAGYGTKEFYQAQGMFNYFKAKQKLSVYGTSSNNGLSGLNWEDADKYGNGNNVQFDGDMAYFTGGNDQGFEGTYWGEGIPRSNNGGVHYDNKWNADKESLNTNYKVGSLEVKTIKNIINQNNLPGNIFNSNSDENSNQYVFRQKLDATYTIKLDTTSNLKIMVDGTLKNNSVFSEKSGSSKREDNSLLNTSSTNNDNKGDDQIFNISAFYNKKLKKAGRNYSVNLSQQFNKKDNTGFIYSKNDFYDENEKLKSQQLVDQYKSNLINTSAFSGNITYNEPLTKATAIVFNYGLNISNSSADRKSFNQSTPGNYDVLDAEFSNDFKALQLVNQAGAILTYKKTKTTLTVGTKVNLVHYDQNEAYTKQNYSRNFVNWLPKASYQYKFSAQKSFRINYDGYTQQPTVEQLQPVRVNTDPLNQPLGNPNLKPSLNNSFNASYNSYKVLSNQSIYLNSGLSFYNNQIVSNTETDENGKTVYQSVNLTSKLPISYRFYGNFSRKIKFIGLDGNIGLNLNGNTSYNYVKFANTDRQLNETNSFNFNPNIGLSKYKDNFNLYSRFGPNYVSQASSLQSNITNKGWGYTGYGGLDFKFLKKYRMAADGEYTYNPPSASFNNSFEQFILNATLTRSFFKKEELKLMVKANDILNQNKGFRRYASANNITQTSYNNISRYFMFSLVWDFSKMGATAKK